MKKRIGIIGYGALSKSFLNLFKLHLEDEYMIAGVLSRSSTVDSYKVYKNLEEMIADKIDYVVEFASASAIREYGEDILNAGIDLIIVSVGALADEEFYENLQEKATKSKAEIYIASGAVGGFDLMRTFALDSNSTVKIRTTKSPESLKGAPYLENKEISEVKNQIIFQGNAKEAIKGFPKNVNVAVATSIAMSGTEKTEVELVSSTGAIGNTHEIFLESLVANATIQISAKKDPENPKSSVITAWSVVALLKNLCSTVKFF